MLWAHCKNHDERFKEGDRKVVSTSKYGMASELGEGSGHNAMDVVIESGGGRAGSGPMHWRSVGQHGTKQYCMALQVGRNDKLEKTEYGLSHVC